MQRFWAYLICLMLIAAGYSYSLHVKYESPEAPEVISKGLVLDMEKIEPQEESEASFFYEEKWNVRVRITEGAFAGREIETIHYYGSNPAYDFLIYPGDKVVLSLDAENNVLYNAYISDLSRDKYVFALLVIFLVFIVAVGGWQGIKTIISLVLTGLAVVKILLPAILNGKDPVTVTVLTCAGITVITHLLIIGLNRKALAAVTGTMIGIISGGILAKYIISFSRISGLGSEESRLFFFSFAEGKIDITGLLFAGIVIGSLGAVMDVAISISSSITEVNSVNPQLTFSQLLRSGLNIGRDIIGTMANTLILAYTGSALPLMLLLMCNNIPYQKYINLDMIATELIRALAGSIGLILAVPFTALVGAALCKGYEKVNPRSAAADLSGRPRN